MTDSRAALVAALTWLLLPAPAGADWIVTPFVGRSLGGQTTLLNFDQGPASQHWVIGASGGWLPDGPLGVEGEISIIPGFFARNDQALSRGGSQVLTVSGHVLAAVPASVTRESLRPYATAGLGLLHASNEDPFFPISRDLLGLSLGGGAIGGISPRTALRFDLRHTRSVRGDADSVIGVQRARLSFWRASIGLTLRY